MARHLNDAEIGRIVDGIEAWQGKLSWESIVDRCEQWIGRRPSRQALARSIRISSAFKAKKKGERYDIGSGGRSPAPSMKIAMGRIERLEAKVQRLERENELLLEQFRRWQYNAHIHGVPRDKLDRPLPAIDLNPT